MVAGDLVIVDNISLKDAKTAGLRDTLGKLGWTRTLIIAGPEVDTNFGLAARNIPMVNVLPNAGLNVYDILRADKLVLTKAASKRSKPPMPIQPRAAKGSYST